MPNGVSGTSALNHSAPPCYTQAMCGRFGFGDPARLGLLPLGVTLPPLTPRFNVAPSQPVPLVRQQGGVRDACLARWGLVPFWADDPAIGNRLVNARSETAHEKPAFRAAFRHRRALIPADLFYEWQPVPGGKGKQPWCIGLPEGAPFVMAALWEQWVPRAAPGTAPLVSCCLLTTGPNATMAPIHDRMPVILPPADWDAWLDPATPAAALAPLLRPYAGPMVAHRVSTLVNNPRHDDPACRTPLPPG